MKIKLFFLIAIFLNADLSAQQKNISTLTASPNNAVSIASKQLTTKNTYALVVGISNYQDPEIPDLRFAHKDAEAFAMWLHSSSGGNVPIENIRLLLNEKATAAQFTRAVDWLIEQSHEGDRVVIYFSGHGDMEAKILNQLGFLLLWDSPAHAYIAGALPVDILKQIVTTLSVENKARVIVVADACHAGKLAGNNIIGTQLTNANLGKQFANEQKILSCQSDEYSIEGEQWGGGRGAFSWYLVNGLYGLANHNNDKDITLLEIERFLQDRVTLEVKPLSQIPLAIGDKTEVIGQVDNTILASLKKGEELASINFYGVEQRGMLQEVLAKADTSIVRIYQSFQQALKEKRFLEPAGNCVEDYYNRLIQEPSIKFMHNYLRWNYAAALQDDAQQVINKWLKTDMSEIALSNKTQTQKYRSYPQYLDRAADLLGSQHYMYPILQSRKNFFEGYLLAMSNRNPDKLFGEKVLTKYRQALKWQPNQPHIYWQMSWVFASNFVQTDSLEYYGSLATTMAPSWSIPYTDVVFFLVRQRQFIRAKPFLEKANLIDSNSVNLMNTWGHFYYGQKQFKEAETKYKKAVQLDSNFIWGYHNLGNIYLSTNRFVEAAKSYEKAIQLDTNRGNSNGDLGLTYLNLGRFAEAEKVLKKGISLDSTDAYVWNLLGAFYLMTNRNSESDAAYNKALSIDSFNLYNYDLLGMIYFYNHRYPESEIQYKKIIKRDSTNQNAYYYLACIQSLQKNPDKAFEYLEQSLKKGRANYEGIQADSDLNLLRERKEQWNTLMKKYFPNNMKN